MIKKKPVKRRRLTEWQRWKKNAPKVPDITCPDIDSIISKLEKHITTTAVYTHSRHNQIVKILEKLRSANERLRDSGEYWYSIAKENLSKTKTD
jgi:CTP:phosphocholine cytidylyltransferase-like protein